MLSRCEKCTSAPVQKIKVALCLQRSDEHVWLFLYEMWNLTVAPTLKTAVQTGSGPRRAWFRRRWKKLGYELRETNFLWHLLLSGLKGTISKEPKEDEEEEDEDAIMKKPTLNWKRQSITFWVWVVGFGCCDAGHKREKKELWTCAIMRILI